MLHRVVLDDLFGASCDGSSQGCFESSSEGSSESLGESLCDASCESSCESSSESNSCAGRKRRGGPGAHAARGALDGLDESALREIPLR